jgi:archaellum component FlaC
MSVFENGWFKNGESEENIHAIIKNSAVERDLQTKKKTDEYLDKISDRIRMIEDQLENLDATEQSRSVLLEELSQLKTILTSDEPLNDFEIPPSLN